MVTYLLFGTMSFSLGLLAFCFGIWLTIWCCNNPNFKEVRASKMAGYFVIVLSVMSLITTSYNAVQTIFMGTAPLFQRSGDRHMMCKGDDMMRHGPMHHSNKDMKEQNRKQ